MIGYSMSSAPVFFDSFLIFRHELSIEANISCPEVPEIVLDFLVKWIDPELVVSGWISMECGEWEISFSMSLALVFISLFVFMI